MDIRKKGILFTFLSIMIAALLSLMYSNNHVTPLDSDTRLEEMRVLSTNQHLTNVITYSKNCLRVSGYRAFQEIIDDINKEGEFYENETQIETAFKELVMNGTIEGIESPTMKNNTLKFLIEKISNASLNQLGITTEINVSDISISQVLPFILTASMNISIHIENGKIKWNYSDTVTSLISIEGLKDPLYFNIGYNQTFKESNYIPGTFNTSEFETFVNRSEYIKVSQSKINISGVGDFYPYSFFGRLTNNASVKNDQSLIIASIINPDRLNDTGIVLLGDQKENISYMDFIYVYGSDAEIPSGPYCDGTLKRVINTTNQPVVDIYSLRLEFNITQEYWEDVNC